MEGTAPDNGNIHATLGIEDNNFPGEDNYGLVFLNLVDDGPPKVPTKIDSIKYDTVLKQSGGKITPHGYSWITSQQWMFLANPTWWLKFVKPAKICMFIAMSEKWFWTVADWLGFGEVWLHHGGIANILSLALMKEMFRITYGSAMGTEANTFVVQKNYGNQHKFVQSTRDL